MERVGGLQAIYRFPVKGMAGELLAKAAVGPRGIEGDRRFAFLRLNSLDPFPWLGVSKMAEMVLYRPRWRDGSSAEAKAIEVVTPDGHVLPLDGAALTEHLSAAHGAPVQLIRMWRGVFDENPLSLIGTATLDALAEETGVPMDARRFRMNFVVQTDVPFIEDTWVGCTLVFGEGEAAPAMRVVMRDMRCAMINVDPDTGERDAIVLKTVTQRHDARAGVYGDPFHHGVLRVGTPVFIT